jgi:formylglycine-generating enzyme required for sulfatase activity
MRLINYQDLLDLIKIAENLEPTFGEAEAASKVRNILLPLQAIDVGNLVRLITSITEVKEPEEPGTIVVVPDGEVPWAESELAKYLKDSTPYQRVLFSALASETRPITTAQLLVLMNDIAKNKSSEKIGKTIGGFDIAGARGGLKMRRKGFKPMREDVLLVKKDEVTGERTYQIRPTYLDQIQLWLRGEGLL